MRRLGSVLMAIGILIGTALSLAIFAGVGGLSFLVAVGLAKLTFITAIAFLGAGALVRRIAIRQEQRAIGRPRPDSEEV